MKSFRTISSLLLAALVLMASSSFYVGVHSCGGSVNAIAFLTEADGCGHQQQPPCHRKASKGCCENDQVVHDGLDFKTTDAIAVYPVQAAQNVLHTESVLAEIIPTAYITPIPYRTDHPPADSGHDIIISIQSFLI